MATDKNSLGAIMADAKMPIFDAFDWTKPDKEDLKLDLNYVSSCEPLDNPFSYKQSTIKNEES